MIDWDLAVRLGSRLAGDGPQVSRREADAAVAELRAGAHRSTDLVRDFTGLDGGQDTAPILVVDRPGWVQANADGFRAVLAPVTEQLGRKKPPSGLSLAVGRRITGSEVGALLGFLGSKVLGQFDPFYDPMGRLLLVAPNIVHVERELGVDPGDFRLWVCLHEETHRVQFTAVPWMRDHLFSLVERLAGTMDSSSLLDDGLARVLGALRQRGSGEATSGSLIELLSTPEQREIMDEVTGMMSLLEGHADVVMDDVGPGVVPSVAAIRRKFDQRRQGIGALDRLLRRLLGLDAKMAQYRDGAAFVRAVVDKVGMAEFNAVFAEAANLPRKADLADPDAWIARVL
ncbi:zinc-dependent metalloprotease [Nocardioides sp. CBS4Y-1]|uniref:Zinc-dependent metalloprotease n=2 Tax=Nocardioides acrostichi TaxID=2784339 RepID=A0A930V2K2_9ACTN|nr:zinc-dependent metalloprotease [Nocardioides acrostichi]